MARLVTARATSAGSSLGFSVVTAVFDPDPEHLSACLASVRATTWDGPVEHVLVDDASTDPRVAPVLATAGAASSTVTVRTRAHNGGIVAASDDAVALARHPWIVLVDHDDVLDPTALSVLAAAIGDHPDVDVVYSDHDLLRPDGLTASPVYKPDLSPEWLRQHNYITHLVAIRRSRFDEVGGFRPGTDGAQDHDLLLRLIESGAEVLHVPEVLLHWRQSPRSVAASTENKPEAFEAGRRVVADHLVRCGVRAEVTAGRFPGIVRIDRRPLEPTPPLVSVVIPTRCDAGRVWGAERTFVVEAVRSIVDRSTHRHLEFVLVVDADIPDDRPARRDSAAEVAAIRDLVTAEAGMSVRTVGYDAPFNFSAKINRGVAAAEGDLLLLLNDDTELIEPTSIERMIGLLGPPPDPASPPRHAFEQPVGAVGAKLLYADGTLQHGGHLYHGEFMHAFLGWGGDHAGPNRMLAVDRECSGVTAAAMLVRRGLLDEIGGFPDDLPLHFNDVDVCCSIRALGYRILWTPHASWYHFEGRTRDRGATMPEWERAASRWPTERPTDPYANPNLVERRADWLELPGRSGAPPYEVGPDGSIVWA